MSFDYVGTAADTLETLREFGAPVTRRVTTTGAYDPSTGASAVASTDSARIGVSFPFDRGTKNAQGSLIQVGDIQLLLDPSGPVEQSDRYIINGSEYTVVSFEKLAPAGIAVLYILHLRLA